MACVVVHSLLMAPAAGIGGVAGKFLRLPLFFLAPRAELQPTLLPKQQGDGAIAISGLVMPEVEVHWQATVS